MVKLSPMTRSGALVVLALGILRIACAGTIGLVPGVRPAINFAHRYVAVISLNALALKDNLDIKYDVLVAGGKVTACIGSDCHAFTSLIVNYEHRTVRHR